MLDELRAAPLLHGARGRPRADVRAAARALVRLGELALDLGPRLRALDVNPLLALPEGQGCLAVDALLVLEGDARVAPTDAGVARADEGGRA
jgi:hypothetical protein